VTFSHKFVKLASIALCGRCLLVRTNKSIGLRIILAVAAIVLGIGVQVSGSLFSKLFGIPALEYIVGLLGFVVMGLCFYKWVIK